MKYVTRILLWPCLLLLVPVLPSSTALGQSSTLSGRVTDATDDRPMPGAVVALVGTRVGTSTDPDGRFILRDLEPGEHTVQVRYLGYESEQYEVTLSGGHGFTLNAALVSSTRPAPIKIAGAVTDADDGSPLGGANVAVQGTEVVTVANADGVFLLRNVPPGTHTLRVSLHGYETNQVELDELESGEGHIFFTTLVKNPNQERTTVSGRISDAADGSPLPGANVTVQGTKLGAATDRDGQYFVRNVPTGAQTVQVSFVGYETEEFEVTLQDGENHELDAALISSSAQYLVTISGRITDAANASPLAGATVTIQGMELGSVTDLDGRFILQNVPAGEQTVQVRFVGYRTQQFEVSLTSSEGVLLYASLNRATDQE